MNKFLCTYGGEVSIYLAPEVEILEISAERGFAATDTIYQDPDFGWDEEVDDKYE